MADLMFGMDKTSSFEKSDANLAQPPVPVNQDKSGQDKMGKGHLVKAAGIIGLMTLTSRVLGMIRDIVTAKQFGTSWQWDAFIYAFMLPNFFRRLVGEGALSTAFIPVYSETLQQKGPAAAFRFANVLNTFVTAFLLIFMLVVELILQLLMRIQFSDPRLHLAFDLLTIFFPYLFFISLFAFGMGVLNCHQHFFTPSLGPVIMDLAWIAAILWVLPFAGKIPEDQLHALAWVLLFSGVLQFAVDIPPLMRRGFRFRWIWDPMNAGLRKAGRLLLPAIVGFSVVQLNLLLDTSCAYFIGPGANSTLWYGTRLMQFPLGVFGIAMGTALLPMIANQVAKKQMEAAKQTLSFALRAVALILFPCAVGLMVLGVPIVQLLFERGHFDAVSTARTASVLFYYSIGLFAYSGEKIVASGFFAIQDTRTPVTLGIVSLIINGILNVILMPYLKEAGLALATSVASIFEFIFLMAIYNRKISPLPLKQITGSVVKILAASSAMGISCFFIFREFSVFFPGPSLQAMLIRVFGSISLSALAYGGFCLLFRVSEIGEAWEWIQKRRKTVPAVKPA